MIIAFLFIFPLAVFISAKMNESYLNTRREDLREAEREPKKTYPKFIEFVLNILFPQ